MDPVTQQCASDPMFIPTHPEGSAASQTRILDATTLQRSNQTCPVTRLNLAGHVGQSARTFMRCCALALYNACGGLADQINPAAEFCNDEFFALQDMAKFSGAPIPHKPDARHPDSVYQSLKNVFSIVKALTPQERAETQGYIRDLIQNNSNPMIIHPLLQQLFTRTIATSAANCNPRAINRDALLNPSATKAAIMFFKRFRTGTANLHPEILAGALAEIEQQNLDKELAYQYQQLLIRAQAESHANPPSILIFTRSVRTIISQQIPPATLAAGQNFATTETIRAQFSREELVQRTDITANYDFYLQKFYAMYQQSEGSNAMQQEEYRFMNLASFGMFYFEVLTGYIDEVCADTIPPEVRQRNRQIAIDLARNVEASSPGRPQI